MSNSPWNIDENYWPGPYEEPEAVVIFRINTVEGLKEVEGRITRSGTVVAVDPIVLSNGETLTIIPAEKFTFTLI